MNRTLTARAWSVLALACTLTLAITNLSWVGEGWADDDDAPGNDNSNQSISNDNKSGTRRNQKPLADVKLLSVGFVTQGGQLSDTVLELRVANVGQVDTGVISGKIEFLSPGPPSERKLEWASIRTGAPPVVGFAQLAAPCDGSIVRVFILAPGETKTDDNGIGPLKLCTDKPKPTDGAIGGVGQSGGPVLQRPVDTTPEHLRPGNHKLTIPARNYRVIQKTYRDGFAYVCGENMPTESEPIVGYWRIDFTDFNDCQVNIVWQTALSFDLETLRPAYGKLLLGQATLLWDDRMTTNDGPLVEQIDPVTGAHDPYAYSCVFNLGIPARDWHGGPVADLLPNDFFDGGRGTAKWDVIRLAVEWLRDPAAEARGLVLRGSDETLNAEDSSERCRSDIRNPRLEIEYAVVR